jgi:hypothetical protein
MFHAALGMTTFNSRNSSGRGLPESVATPHPRNDQGKQRFESPEKFKNIATGPGGHDYLCESSTLLLCFDAPSKCCHLMRQPIIHGMPASSGLSDDQHHVQA